MQKLDSFVNKYEFSKNNNNAHNEGELDPNTVKIVDRLFLTLTAIFPAFKQNWGNEHEYKLAKTQWIKAFIESDLRAVNKIEVGISACRKMTTPFIPSPGLFIALCNERKPPEIPVYTRLLDAPRNTEIAKSSLKDILKELKK